MGKSEGWRRICILSNCTCKSVLCWEMEHRREMESTKEASLVAVRIGVERGTPREWPGIDTP